MAEENSTTTADEDIAEAVGSGESPADAESAQGGLEGGSYEIIRNRLSKIGDELLQRINQLNGRRKEVFGALDNRLIGQDQILTDTNCVPIDMKSLGGNRLIFGYRVYLGLKTTPKISDVFSLYEFKDDKFEPAPADFLETPAFVRDFNDLFNYYKNSRFVTFHKDESRLLMIFQVGKESEDIRAFKWLLNGDNTLTYVNNRAEREYVYPPQHEFEWRRATRDQQVYGTHPHISIEDKVFVECTGGDLTIKVENSTETGAGIYSEDVEHKDQTLDDAEIHYAVLEHIVLLRIKPFREKDYRYIIFNEKTEKAVRVDDIEQSAIRLPEDDGLIFPRGYYLESGEYKRFELEIPSMQYRKLLSSSNGEDFLYVFFNADLGEYVLLQYNLIEKKVENPIYCHGFALYEDGKMIFFKGDEQAKKNHGIQIWQTPFVSDKHMQLAVKDDSELNRIGNKELVRGIADLRSVYNLLRTDKVYLGLYHQIVRKVTNTLDFHHWMGSDQVFNPKGVLQSAGETAKGALEEYEKVVQIRANTENAVKAASSRMEKLELELGGRRFEQIEQYVETLASLRTERGKIISLKELRYVDEAKVDELEAVAVRLHDVTARGCVEFLLKPEALTPFMNRLDEYEGKITELEKVSQLKELGEKIEEVNESANLLTEMVNNLEIDDATQTTSIINNISNVYTRINQVKAAHKKYTHSLHSQESKEEFAAQFKLISQTVATFLDQADSPERCEELLTRVLVQLEELEARFADFDEYVEELSRKREEVYSAFNSRKVQLEEGRNKRSATLWKSAERILKGVSNRMSQLKDIDELNAYFAGDAMITRVRDIVEKLADMGDQVKSEDIAGRLKSLKQEGARQLKDKLDLFAEGADVISLGRHKFLINTQSAELTTVNREGEMCFHLTGTEFFETIRDENFEETRPFWERDLPSETPEIYRAEYLAYKIIHSVREEGKPISEKELHDLTRDLEREFKGAEPGELRKAPDFQKLTEAVRSYMAGRYSEGYEKGVHDADCARLLVALYPVYARAGALRFAPDTRAYGYLYWRHAEHTEEKELLGRKIRAFGLLGELTPTAKAHPVYIEQLSAMIAEWFENEKIPARKSALRHTADYLFEELKAGHGDAMSGAKGTGHMFPINGQAHEIYTAFRDFLKSKSSIRRFNETVKSVGPGPAGRLSIIKDWVEAFVAGSEDLNPDFVLESSMAVLDETLDDKLDGDLDSGLVVKIDTTCTAPGMMGRHPRIEDGVLRVDVAEFLMRLDEFETHDAPRFREYTQLKHDLTEKQKEIMRLDEFKPRIMSAFVRNKLIDTAYLPLIGANLAKQMGSYGDQKRTDLMGLLMLISPPGYGKTTLMEYIANRLGLIFMKINGPAIGHNVVSLDPQEAPNATAREEVNKLNLALEMGNNVMIYLDDIQHTHPEFLQKFISLCDAQRKIEGVYRGRTRTYDLRGKRVSVVMAGNPYTESGEKFQVPDMLANRADVYNLGDVLGGHEDAFNLSYLENSLTSNPVLNQLTSRDREDVYTLIRMTRTGEREGASFKGNISQEEAKELTAVFERLLKIQNVVLQVNQQYIYSAAQDDAFRTEPNFLLQGSYRNMNKMVEKVAPIMNEAEMKQLVLDHYTDESQLLTSGAEFNLLRFKEMMEWLNDEERERLNFIRESYRKNKAMGEGDSMGRIIGQLNVFNDRFQDLVAALVKDK